MTDPERLDDYRPHTRSDVWRLVHKYTAPPPRSWWRRLLDWLTRR